MRHGVSNRACPTYACMHACTWHHTTPCVRARACVAGARYVAASMELYDASPRPFSVLDYLFNPHAVRPTSAFNATPVEVLSQVRTCVRACVPGGRGMQMDACARMHTHACHVDAFGMVWACRALCSPQRCTTCSLCCCQRLSNVHGHVG